MEKVLEQILEKLMNSDKPAEAIRELRGLLEDQYRHEKEKRESFLKWSKEEKKEKEVIVEGIIENLSKVDHSSYQPLALVLRQDDGTLISVNYSYKNPDINMIHEKLKTAKENNKRVILDCETEGLNGILRGRYKIKILD